ncbi:MAG TPA: WYL domain-containing protein [Acidimicrobiia bacterium]|nr:WYL domain-containing protein [Acidimicrobiia bacterium]
MRKLERLLDLVAALLAAEGPLSRHQLRERMPPGAYSQHDENFRRTFERDKDDLRGMGLPIVVEPIPATDPPLDGYLIHRSDYEDDLPALSPDELAALHLASNVVRLQDAPTDDPFWRLGGVPGPDRTPVGVVAEVPADEAVRILMAATAERRVVSFGYNDRDRTVEPHRLVFTRGRWYLAGRDLLPGEARQFRVDRITGPVTVGDPGGFDTPDTPAEVNDDPAWRYGDDEVLVARLQVDGRHVPWVVDFLGGSAVVEERGDGSVVVEETVRNRAAFRSFVLTFLDGAEVLGPRELRDDMTSWLRALL